MIIVSERLAERVYMKPKAQINGTLMDDGTV